MAGEERAARPGARARLGLPRGPRRAPCAGRRSAAGLGGPLPAAGSDPVAVLEALAAAAEPGLVASAGPRYFGFVTGGALPVALAADWLCATWDQNAGLHVMSPAAAVAEEAVGGWVRELLGLPADARRRLRHRRPDGQLHRRWRRRATRCSRGRAGTSRRAGSPARRALRVLAGEEAHVTVVQRAAAARARARHASSACPPTAQGRMRADALDEALAGLRAARRSSARRRAT